MSFLNIHCEYGQMNRTSSIAIRQLGNILKRMPLRRAPFRLAVLVGKIQPAPWESNSAVWPDISIGMKGEVVPRPHC
jgi:hypothetical protein